MSSEKFRNIGICPPELRLPETFVTFLAFVALYM
jgi:hypothetical protein